MGYSVSAIFSDRGSKFYSYSGLTLGNAANEVTCYWELGKKGGVTLGIAYACCETEHDNV